MGRSPRLCGIWVGLALLFGGGLWALEGSEAGETYFAGYVMEKALSLDNVFVFTLIFSALAVPCEEQPRILLWGVLIALVLRAAFIFAGAEALESYSWVAWPFAALLASPSTPFRRFWRSPPTPSWCSAPTLLLSSVYGRSSSSWRGR